MQPEAQAATRSDSPGARRRGVRRTALVCALVAAAFYLGFIVMMLVRASR